MAEEKDFNKRIKEFSFYKEIEVPKNLIRFVKEEEKILLAIKTVRDAALITDRKILICDKKGVTGKKVEYFAIPFKKIVTYAIETNGILDIDAELKIEVPGQSIKIKLMKSKNTELLFKIYDAVDSYMING